uniref:Uncharacterized protein n=1 Tax=Macrostomum lignano TaxID=282301 RepID=A0A1I8FT95_9PLAT
MTSSSTSGAKCSTPMTLERSPWRPTATCLTSGRKSCRAPNRCLNDVKYDLSKQIKIASTERTETCGT